MKSIKFLIILTIVVTLAPITYGQIVIDNASSKPILSRYEALKKLKNVNADKRYDMSTSINGEYFWFFDRLDDQNNRKYGIARKDGVVILPAIFSRNYGSGNRVIMYMSGNYGMFNLNTLSWDIPLIYSSLNEMNGLYIAQRMNSYGVIDSYNQVLLDFKWSSINSISGLDNYVIVAKPGSPALYGIYNLIEKEFIIPCKYQSIQTEYGQMVFRVKKNDKFNIIDIRDSTRFKTWYEEISNISGSNNYLVKKNNLFGIINGYEEVLIPMEYLELSRSSYNDGSFLAKNKNSKYGFITLKGEITLPFQYDKISDQYNNNFTAFKDGKCGLVRVNSGIPQEIQTCNFDEINNKQNIIITKKGDKFGILDKFGKEIVVPKYDDIELLNTDSYQNNQIIIAKDGDNMYMMNELGSIIDQTPYIEIVKVVSRKNNYSFSYIKGKDRNGKYKIIDKTGRSISKMHFDEIINEDMNIFLVIEKGKMGMFNLLTNKMIVDCKYDQIIFSDGVYIGINAGNFDFFEINGGKLTML